MPDSLPVIGADSASTRHRPVLAADVDAIRDGIRRTLTFEHRPLAGKGDPHIIGMPECAAAPYKQIIAEMLVAFWETGGLLTDQSAARKLSSLRRVKDFIEDRVSPYAKAHAPHAPQDLTFDMLRDFERWVQDRKLTVRSQLADRIIRLRERLKTPLPLSNRMGGSLVSAAQLSVELGWVASAINQSMELLQVLTEGAGRLGLRVMPSVIIAIPAREKPSDGTVRAKGANDLYLDVAALLRHALTRRPELFNPEFIVPAPAHKVPASFAKTPALSPAERDTVREACIRSIRATIDRLNVDPRAAVTGDGVEPTPPHPACEKQDLIPFLLTVGLSEHAPLNLSSLLRLRVDPDDPMKHWRQPSPTPGHAKVVISKARGSIDRLSIDVPDRGLFDIPRLLCKVEAITADLRREATGADKCRLWLYQSRRGEVCALKESEINTEVARYAATVGLSVSDDPIHLTFRRLRPTAITDVAFADGIEEAQRRAAHANPAETFRYASNPTSEPRLGETALRAQGKAIASTMSGLELSPGQDEVLRLAGELAIQEGAAREILQGERDKLFSACINDTNGAGPVRKGTSCGVFEACLICQNSVILERHLVRLITYQTHWLSLADSMSEEAWAERHELNCAIVDVHLAKFEEGVVARHRRTAAVLALKAPGFRLSQT